MEVVARFRVRDKQAGQLKDLLLGLRHHIETEGLTIEEHEDGKPVLDGQRAAQDHGAGERPGDGKGGEQRGGGARKDGIVSRAARKVATALKK